MALKRLNFTKATDLGPEHHNGVHDEPHARLRRALDLRIVIHVPLAQPVAGA